MREAASREGFQVDPWERFLKGNKGRCVLQRIGDEQDCFKFPVVVVPACPGNGERDSHIGPALFLAHIREGDVDNRFFVKEGAGRF